MEHIALWRSSPFFLMHAACALVFWFGASPFAVWTCATLYFVRMFAITAGYHRYFAHASYKTSRWFQFVLAWIGASSVQKGPLWWAAHHRHHHAHSDTEADIHSPVTRNFWWSHMGWFLCTKYDDTPLHLIRPYSQFPELRWLNDYHAVPGILLGATLAITGNWLAIHAPQFGTNGPQLVLWGLISTVLLYHGTFTVNSLAHVFGSRRYQTKDDSRNNLLIALITLGEGWHNNHHYAPSSERQGFFWWEIDIAHYVLVALSWLGVVWDLKRPPPRVYEV